MSVAAAIPQLEFAVTGAAPVAHAAAPLLRLDLRVACPSGEPIRSVVLDVQVQIAARRRAYDAAAHDRLFELFGPPEAWSATLRTLLWTRATLVVAPFTGETTAALDVPCSYDLEVAATRYFDALGDGDVPLELLFGGSVFYTAPDGRLQTARIPWAAEAAFKLPVATWKATMAAHFRDTAWIRLSKDAFDRLAAHRSRHALPSWEALVDRLLAADAGEAPWTR